MVDHLEADKQVKFGSKLVNTATILTVVQTEYVDEGEEQRLKQNKDTPSQVAQKFEVKQQLKYSLSDKPTKCLDMEEYDFNLGFTWILRVLFIQTTWLMRQISSKVTGIGEKLKLFNLPQLRLNEKVESQFGIFNETMDKVAGGEKIEGSHVLKMVRYIFRKEFALSHLLIASGLALKSVSSVVVQKIITVFEESGPTSALGYAFILLGIMLLNQIFNNQSFNYVQTMSTQIRLNLVAFLYTKAVHLTNFQMQKANIGKLFNLISYDLSTLEMMTYFALMIFYVPLLLVIAAIILYFRLGGYGLLGILIIFLMVPLQLFMGIKSKNYFGLKNKYSDARIKLVSESVDGVRLMKMYGWETAFSKFVADVRKEELSAIKGLQLYRASDRAASMSFALIATFVPILLIYKRNPQDINTSMIYSTLEQLFGLRSILFLTGVGLGFFFQLGLILNRFAEFMRLKSKKIANVKPDLNFNKELNIQQIQIRKKKSELESKKAEFLKINSLEVQKNKQLLNQFDISEEEKQIISRPNRRFIETEVDIPPTTDSKFAVELTDFSSYWSLDSNPTLQNINLKIQKGKQYGIVGKVGAGKSTLLQVILGEMPYFQGGYKQNGSVCFVEQEPYVFSGKFIDNITFGQDYDEPFYKEVIKVCCLEDDLDQFPDRDNTEIGEKGVTLSGGQKARLSLARAVYSKNDIYLLDDPLSAVDSKVARKLYQNLLNGLLKGKTVILVTHQIHFTKSCDEIFVLDDGVLSHRGNFSQLQKILLQMANQQTFGEDNDNDAQGMLDIQADEFQQNVVATASDNLITEKKPVGELFIAEAEEKFNLSFTTYKRYFSYVRSWGQLSAMIMLYLISEGLYTAFYYIFGSYDNTLDKEQLFLLSGILLGVFIIVNITKYLTTVLLIGKANANMHEDMFKSISRAPVVYFDQTPSGRILNKFSNDIGSIDLVLPFMTFDVIEGPLQLINIYITVGVLNPWIFLVGAGMIVCCAKCFSLDKPIIIQSKQLDLMFRSPVFSFFSRTIQGIVHIRIYKQVNNFVKAMCQHINNSIRTNYAVWRFNRAFSFNMQIITTVFSFSGIIICLYSLSTSHALGQSIVYLTMLVDNIYVLSRQLPNFDSNMTQVERVLQICGLQSEDNLLLPSDEKLYDNNDKEQKCSWIKRGEIEFNNVEMKYRKDLEYVLRGSSFKISGGERVGCVGRTGAGKSSLLQALFRMTEIEQTGSILIDGVDTTSIGLHTLRNSISMIPQTPFVFSGSIKRNLDPLGEYSDESIWKVLEQAELLDTVKSLSKGLETDMSNAQSVFSTGQKQLICLARAILRKSQILVLDEATANVDMRTDEFIQQAIRQQFIGSTIFTIAHRLNTIADYDKVVVMDKGIVAEFDSPYHLLVHQIGDQEITSSSIFASMVRNTGKENALNIFQTAQKKYNEVQGQK